MEVTEVIQQALQTSSVDVLEGLFLMEEQVECQVIHHFAPGEYRRELRVPAGTFLIGHRQKHPHMNDFVKGKVIMIEPNSVVTLEAPMFFEGQPGRKIGFVVEEMVWINIFKTDETDVDKLEEMFFDKSDGFKEFQSRKLSAQKAVKISYDQEDFASFLEHFGLTKEQVDQIAFNESDMIDLPPGEYKFKVTDSNIHGKGMMATANIQAGEIIAPASIGEKRTVAGRYTNHSMLPNAMMVRREDGFNLVALSDISGSHGADHGEEITVDYSEVYKHHLVQTCQA